MFKIPLKMVNVNAFYDHGWRFGNPKAFYIIIDFKGKKFIICIQNYYQMFDQNEGANRRIYSPFKINVWLNYMT